MANITDRTPTRDTTMGDRRTITSPDDAVRVSRVRRALKDGTLEAARERAKLSVSDVTGAIGVAHGTYHHWTTGRRSPRTEHALALADLFDNLGAALTVEYVRTVLDAIAGVLPDPLPDEGDDAVQDEPAPHNDDDRAPRRWLVLNARGREVVRRRTYREALAAASRLVQVDKVTYRVAYDKVGELTPHG